MESKPQVYRPTDRLYRVTEEGTGVVKEIAADSPGGAVKISNIPPALAQVTDITRAAPAGVLEFPETTDRGSNSALTAHQKEALILWGSDLGIRPDLGHACIMYGKPYVTVDGLAYHAKTVDPDCRYEIEHLSLAAKTELGLDVTTFAAICRVYSGAGVKLAERIGTVTSEEITERSTNKPENYRYPIVHKKPFEMVENRALWDALGDAFPLGIAGPAELGVGSLSREAAMSNLLNLGYLLGEAITLLDSDDEAEKERIKIECQRRAR